MTKVGQAMLDKMVKGPERGPVPMGDRGAAAVEAGEGQLLYGLVRALKPMVVLEIGTGHGFSTLHLAGGCRDNGLGTVFSVEPDDTRRFMAGENLSDAGLLEWVSLMARLPGELRDIDFAFVDAVHTAEAVRGYLAYLAGRMTPGGVVVVHDPLLGDHLTWSIHELRSHDTIRCVRLAGTSKYGIAIMTLEDK